MKLREYIDKLNQIVTQEPNLLDCTVVHNYTDFQQTKNEFVVLTGRYINDDFQVDAPLPFIERGTVDTVCLYWEKK